MTITADTEVTTPRVFTLDPTEYAATCEKIAKINDRAARKGFTGRITVTGTHRHVSYVNEFTGLTVEYDVIDTTLSGEAPSYGGWTFLAAVDWVNTAGTPQPVVHTAPGVEGIDRSALVYGACAHCNTTRARVKSFIVGDADGNQVQVGSTCIKDFLGWTGNPVFLSSDDVERDIESISAGSHEYLFTPLSVLTAAWAAIRVFGYVRSQEPGATADLVRTALGIYRPTSADKEILAQLQPFVAESEEQARKVLEFITSDEFTGTSEYVQNLKTIAGADYIGNRSIGILASAPQAYAKAQERTLIRQREAAQPSEWVGTVGQKVTVTATIVSVRYSESQYGTTVIYRLRDEAGNIFTWFASREALGDKDGVTVTLTGTVKAHDEFKGTKSTIITRCKKA